MGNGWDGQSGWCVSVSAFGSVHGSLLLILVDNLMVVDPIWAQAIKDLVKQRAADQQARAIAQSMINRERGLAV